MKQTLQNLNTGKTLLEEVPCPHAQSDHLLIRTAKSLVSASTERMRVEFGKANLIEKARQQPDKVRMVLDKVKTEVKIKSQYVTSGIKPPVMKHGFIRPR